VRTDSEDLLGLIVGLAGINGIALDLCVTEPGASAMPQHLKALIMLALLIDVVVALLALYLVVFKFSRRGRVVAEDLLSLIVGLAGINGIALDLCITEPGASAMPQHLKALIMLALLIDVVVLLLVLYLVVFKFSRRGRGVA